MKKLLLLIGLVVAFPVMGMHEYVPMDGKTHQVQNDDAYFLNFLIQHSYTPFDNPIKPFHCKIWTNYTGDPGYGIVLQIYSRYAKLYGNYPSGDIRVTMVAKGSPIELYAMYGKVYFPYKDVVPIATLADFGCSHLDSKCTYKSNTTVFEECNLI